MSLVTVGIITVGIGAVCTSKLAPRFIRDAVAGVASQLFWGALLLLYIPAMWKYSLGLDRYEVTMNMNVFDCCVGECAQTLTYSLPVPSFYQLAGLRSQKWTR
jgi:hypothetical protein